MWYSTRTGYVTELQQYILGCLKPLMSRMTEEELQHTEENDEEDLLNSEHYNNFCTYGV